MSIKAIQETFIKGDRQYGPIPFWWWSGTKITKEGIAWQLEKYYAGGLRNLGVINMCPTGPQNGSVTDDPLWFSDQWWELYTFMVEKAQALGMHIWFYDQIGFSGGNVPARIVSEEPAYAGYQLKRYPTTEVLPPQAKLVATLGDYQYVETRQGFDWLNPAACQLLLDQVYGELERRLGSFLGSTIIGSMEDELSPLPMWSPALMERYERQYGHSLRPLLPLLFDEEPASSTVRRRVYELAADLAETAFFKPLGAWHEDHQLFLSCDQAGPARRANVHGAQRLYLDYFKNMRHYNCVGCDMDGEVKPHASISHLHGGQRVWLEAFHSSGWGGTIEETMNWLVPMIQGGVTMYSPHATFYTTKGGWWEWAAPDTGWRQPYFEEYPLFVDTLSRIFFLLTQGVHQAGLGVYYPGYAATGYFSLNDGQENQHPMVVASKIHDATLAKIQATYEELTGSWSRRNPDAEGLIRSLNVDFDLIDDLALEKAEIVGQKLVINGESFTALIFPSTAVMRPKAQQKITQWRQQGGQVLLYQPVQEGNPENLPVTDDQECVKHFIQENVECYVKGAGHYLHRQFFKGEGDIFLLLPPQEGLLKMHEATTPQKEHVAATTFSLKTSGKPQIWNPVKGEICDVPYVRQGAWVRLQATFQDWPACLVVCTGTDDSLGLEPPIQEVSTSLTLDKTWQFQVIPTLDNRFGDFDLHDYQGKKVAVEPLESRLVQVKMDHELTPEERASHCQKGEDLKSWSELLWSEGFYWEVADDASFSQKRQKIKYSKTFGDLSFKTWAGRMGHIPRRFISLGTLTKDETKYLRSWFDAPTAGQYWLRLEGSGTTTVWLDGQEVSTVGGNEDQQAQLSLTKGTHELVLKTQATRNGLVRLGVEVNSVPPTPLPKWIYLTTPTKGNTLNKVIFTPQAKKIAQVVLNFSSRGRVQCLVNETLVTEIGDFDSYARQGQEQVTITKYWQAGMNTLSFCFPEGVGETFVDGAVHYQDGTKEIFYSDHTWQDKQGEACQEFHDSVLRFSETESLWYNERPHPLPQVGWLMPASQPKVAPLAFYLPENKKGEAVWLKVTLPQGVQTIHLPCNGAVRAWIAGKEYPVLQQKVQLTPVAAGTSAIFQITPTERYSYAEVLTSPIVYDTQKSSGQLGSWLDVLHLEGFSGVVEYEKEFTLPQAGQLTLDLGFVRGTAKVWVDGKVVGTRLWQPYTFELAQTNYAAGKHTLKVRVASSLGAHYHFGRPSDVVGGENQYWNPQEEMTGKRQRFIETGLFGPVSLNVF